MPSRRDPADLADQAAFIGALTAPRVPVEGLHNGRGRPAADRFAVYRNNVAHSLVEALGTTFAATKATLGEDQFRALALTHVREEPPSSPVLFTYGATLPNRLADPVLRDLALLEHARVQAFHAADAEPAGMEALSAVAPEELPALTLCPHPAAKLIPMEPAAIARFQAHVGAAEAPDATACLISRPRFDVLVTPLDAPTATMTAGLFDGAPLGEAAAVDGLDLGAALAALFNAGAIKALG